MLLQAGDTPLRFGSAVIKAVLRHAPEIRHHYLTRLEMGRRCNAMLRFRRAHEAHRDARLVFRAAAEGRPLEL